jgi:uncharacterized protein YjbI with pentapeptide repeats
MTDNESKPESHRPKKSLASRLSRAFRRGAIRLENSALFMYLRAVSRAGIILIAIGFFLDHDDRQAATKFRAWQTISSVAPGNIGKAEAMEYLVAVGEVLDRTEARNAYLAGARLKGVSLSYADLSAADLTGADLREATLIEGHLDKTVMPNARLDKAILDETRAVGVNLIGASLTGASASGVDFSEASLDAADFTAADLSYANLSRVTLAGATLTDAILSMANMSGADFGGIAGVTAAQLKTVCIVDGARPINMPAHLELEDFSFADCGSNAVWQRRLSSTSTPSR